MQSRRSRGIRIVPEFTGNDVWLTYSGYLLAAAAMAYGVVAWLATLEPLRPPCPMRSSAPGVTVLKPLCGAEPETYECLRSFCDQAYPELQVLFGVADPDDPVIAIVERLRCEFPQRDVRIIVDRSQHGGSRKISNLINLMPRARHDYFVLADSDVRVERDYLSRVIAPLLEPGVGLVTCPYRGVSQHGLWSALGSLFINDWFMPSVCVAAKAGSRCFAFGSTIALRRNVLAQIGGFEAIANHLADDYQLGELTRRLGLRTVLSEVEVEVAVAENSFKELAQHELRWLRTIRTVRPLAYSFCFVTFGVPVAMIGTLLTEGRAPAWIMLATTIAARVLLHLRRRPARPSGAQVILLPLRDFLSLGLWGWSFITRRVRWRDAHYQISRDGSVLPIVRM